MDDDNGLFCPTIEAFIEQANADGFLEQDAAAPRQPPLKRPTPRKRTITPDVESIDGGESMSGSAVALSKRPRFAACSHLGCDGSEKRDMFRCPGTASCGTMRCKYVLCETCLTQMLRRHDFQQTCPDCSTVWTISVLRSNTPRNSSINQLNTTHWMLLLMNGFVPSMMLNQTQTATSETIARIQQTEAAMQQTIRQIELQLREYRDKLLKKQRELAQLELARFCQEKVRACQLTKPPVPLPEKRFGNWSDLTDAQWDAYEAYVYALELNLTKCQEDDVPLLNDGTLMRCANPLCGGWWLPNSDTCSEVCGTARGDHVACPVCANAVRSTATECPLCTHKWDQYRTSLEYCQWIGERLPFPVSWCRIGIARYFMIHLNADEELLDHIVTTERIVQLGRALEVTPGQLEWMLQVAANMELICEKHMVRMMIVYACAPLHSLVNSMDTFEKERKMLQRDVANVVEGFAYGTSEQSFACQWRASMRGLEKSMLTKIVFARAIGNQLRDAAAKLARGIVSPTARVKSFAEFAELVATIHETTLGTEWSALFVKYNRTSKAAVVDNNLAFTLPYSEAVLPD